MLHYRRAVRFLLLGALCGTLLGTFRGTWQRGLNRSKCYHRGAGLEGTGGDCSLRVFVGVGVVTGQTLSARGFRLQACLPTRPVWETRALGESDEA